MEVRILLVFILYGTSNVLSSGGSTTTEDKWVVRDHITNHTCIMMKSEITLSLQYNLNGYNDQVTEWEEVEVPSTSHVGYESSCETEFQVQIDHEYYNISSQVLSLELDNAPGWIVNFYFSNDKHISAKPSQYVMYYVSIEANYSSLPNIFKHAKSDHHLYEQPSLSTEGQEFGVQGSIYADTKYSYFCPSSQEYHVVDDPEQLGAQITFKEFQVQAYTDSDHWNERDTCPADQTASDKVPVIVGGVLAGLVLITLVVYLIYRSRLPPSVLYLTNPHSHFEDLAFDNKGHNIEDDDENGEEHGHGHNHENHNHEHHVHYNHSEQKTTHFTEIEISPHPYKHSASSQYSNAPSYE